MKYLVGYSLSEPDQPPFTRLLEGCWDGISEVYFPWPDMATGRSALSVRQGCTDWSAQERLEAELRVVKSRGVRLDLLLNANCYGRYAISETLDRRVVSILERLEEAVGGADVVTTTSPFLAERVKKRFPRIEVRASVNMWIGTVKAMEYLSELYDSFYVQREYNRDLEHVKMMSEWCRGNGKGLYMLANSGCLGFCTGHTFHDNLVAHEQEILDMKNVEDFTVHTCARYLKDRAHWPAILQSSWIRPEDMYRYDGLVLGAKLATRAHSHPGLVISSYVHGRFRGNLLDLCEPGFGPALAPYIIDNTRMPADFFERTTRCDKLCHKCDYCRRALESALTRMG